MSKTIILKSKNIYTGKNEHYFEKNKLIVIKDNLIHAINDFSKLPYWLQKEPEAKLIDLGDGMLSPGFVDNHVFFTGYVWSHLGVDLSFYDKFDDVLMILDTELKQSQKMVTIYGHHLDNAFCTAEYSKRLNQKFPESSLVLFNEERNYSILTNIAKAKYKLEPDDIYAENCYMIFDEILRNEEFILNEYQNFSKLLASRGVTAIKEIGFDSYSNFTSALLKMENEKKLTHRVNLVFQPVSQEIDYDYAAKCHSDIKSNVVTFMGYNFMTDGEICTKTADITQPYLGDNKKLDVDFDYDNLKEKIQILDELGIRCCIHAEGDNAVKKSINILKDIKSVSKFDDIRHSIIDLELTKESDLEIMGKYGINAINYVQIMNSIGDYNDFYGYDLVGSNRIKDFWAYKKMIDHNVLITCGTDLPLDIPNIPLSVFYTTKRQFNDFKPNDGINMKSAIEVKDILQAWTRNGQFINYKDNILGTIEEGKIADLTVLSNNLFADLDNETLLNTNVDMTMFNGEIIYKK